MSADIAVVASKNLLTVHADTKIEFAISEWGATVQKVGAALIENDVSCRKYYYFFPFFYSSSSSFRLDLSSDCMCARAFFLLCASTKPKSKTMAEMALRKIYELHSHGNGKWVNRELKTNTEWH